MFNKIYESFKKIIKENLVFLIGLFVGFLLFTVKLPFYIDTPGGLIDVSERIKIEDSYEVKGSLNLAYVLEFKATLPTLIYAYFNNDWDILKKEEVVAENTSIEEIEYRNHLMLEEANQNALYVGFTKAGLDVLTLNHKVYISYVAIDAVTDLKIGDQIIAINDKKINSKEDTYLALENAKVGEEIRLTVLKDDKEYARSATLQDSNGRAVIGVLLSETKDVKVPKNYELKFKKSESGPSGGFMMSLAIYNYLTEKDITNGLKIVGTGTIDSLGNVGSIGGVEYKIKAAAKQKADIFFVPEENYQDALKVMEEKKYNMKLVKISKFDEAIDYLNSLTN